jgi:hypothetical protein
MAGKAPAAAYADYSFPDDHCSSADNCRSSAVRQVVARRMRLLSRPPAITGSRWTADRTGLQRPSRRVRPGWSPASSTAFPSTHPHALRKCAGAGERRRRRLACRGRCAGRGADSSGSVSRCRESSPSDASGPARPSAGSPRPGRTRRCPRPSAGHDRVAGGRPSSCRG